MEWWLDGVLTVRQEQLARLLSEDLSNKEIGQKMGVAEQTVANQMKCIMARLGVRGRVGVAVYVRTGWLPVGASCPTSLEKAKARWYSTRNMRAA